MSAEPQVVEVVAVQQQAQAAQAVEVPAIRIDRGGLKSGSRAHRAKVSKSEHKPHYGTSAAICTERAVFFFSPICLLPTH